MGSKMSAGARGARLGLTRVFAPWTARARLAATLAALTAATFLTIPTPARAERPDTTRSDPEPRSTPSAPLPKSAPRAPEGSIVGIAFVGRMVADLDKSI